MEPEQRLKAGDVIIISPLILRFHAPFNRIERRTINIMNTSEHVILFKIKTNTTKIYSVKPNCSLIPPYEMLVVEVTQNPFEYDEAATQANHKFIVQSLIATDAKWIAKPLLGFEQVNANDISSMRIDVLLDAGDFTTDMLHPVQDRLPDKLLERVLKNPNNTQLTKHVQNLLRPVCPACNEHQTDLVNAQEPQAYKNKQSLMKRVAGVTVFMIVISFCYYLKNSMDDEFEAFTTAY